MNDEALTDWLRRRVLGLVHVGRAQPGMRLPSIREVARRSGADHRAVADAYRALESEGLVEVRAASGVFVKEGAGGPDGETTRTGDGSVVVPGARWLATLLEDGWAQRLSAGQMREALRVLAEPLRVACVESVEDASIAIAAELEQDFGMHVTRVTPASLAGEDTCDMLAEVELIVTSAFHEQDCQRAAAGHGVPCEVIRVHDEFAAELDELLTRAERVTLVAVDERMLERMSRYMSVTAHAGKTSGLTVDALPSGGIDDLAGPVLVTRAARRRLGMDDYHLIAPPPPYIGVASARALWGHVAGGRERRG